MKALTKARRAQPSVVNWTCTPSTLTFLADQLERRGLVERAPSPDDGRRRVVALTARGRAVRQEVVSAPLDARPLTRLDDDEIV